MDDWSNLSIAEKAKYIQLLVANGVTNLGTINDVMNDYFTRQIVDDVNNRSNADFVNRLKDPNRETIQDWEDPSKVATHKMGYDRLGKDDPLEVVYPSVQNINEQLHDFTDPKYGHSQWNALDSAIERGDTLMMTPRDAELFIKGYKNYYPTFNRYDEGGLKSANEQALKRAKEASAPYSNYLNAVDMEISPITLTKYMLNKAGIQKNGLSNCILTLSQFYNPERPIASNRTIVNNPIENGFYEIPEEYSGVGSLIIASEPGKKDDGSNKYHAMMITGYADKDYNYSLNDKTYPIKKGDPLVTYSSGKNTPENLKRDVPLQVYTDNSNGKTLNRYYNHLNENNIPTFLLPEVTITPDKSK